MKKGLATAVVVLALAGCASTGNKRVDLTTVSSFKPGVTTMAQAEEVLGPPFQESRQPDGTDHLQYLSKIRVSDSDTPITGTRIPPQIDKIVSMMLAFDQQGLFIHAWSGSKTVNENVPGNLGHLQEGDVSHRESNR